MIHFGGKEKSIFAGALWLVALCGFVLGVVFPLYLRLQQFPETYKSAWREQQGIDADIAKFAQLRREFEEITQNIARIKALFLDPRDYVSFIESVEGLAKELSLYMEKEQVSEPPAGPSADDPAFVFRLTMVGPFEQVMQFIYRMEHDSYAIDVEKSTIMAVKEEKTYGLQKANETGAGYTTMPGDVAANLIIRVHAAQ